MLGATQRQPMPKCPRQLPPKSSCFPSAAACLQVRALRARHFRLFCPTLEIANLGDIVARDGRWLTGGVMDWNSCIPPRSTMSDRVRIVSASISDIGVPLSVDANDFPSITSIFCAVRLGVVSAQWLSSLGGNGLLISALTKAQTLRSVSDSERLRELMFTMCPCSVRHCKPVS